MDWHGYWIDLYGIGSSDAGVIQTFLRLSTRYSCCTNLHSELSYNFFSRQSLATRLGSVALCYERCLHCIAAATIEFMAALQNILFASSLHFL